MVHYTIGKRWQVGTRVIYFFDVYIYYGTDVHVLLEWRQLKEYVLQGVSIACYAEHALISYDRFVRPSFHLSVTRWHCVKMTQAISRNLHRRIAQGLLVLVIRSSSRNSKGFIPREDVKWEWGRKNSYFSANKSPYLSNGARWDQSYY